MDRVFVAVISLTVIAYGILEPRRYPAKPLFEILMLGVAELTFAVEVYVGAKDQDWGWFAGGISGLIICGLFLGLRLWDHFQGGPIARMRQEASHKRARLRSERGRPRL